MPDTSGTGPVSSTSCSVLVRSDQDSGMALVKSKDGRTEWLTVNADPAAPTYSWDERVRTWAGKLGVCASPSPPREQGTPLPTPPPQDPRSQHDWLTLADGGSTMKLQTASPASPAAAKIRAGGAKRAGAFTRGFLLGLGGGGVNSFTAKRNNRAVKANDDGDINDLLIQELTPTVDVSDETRRIDTPRKSVGRQRWIKGASSSSGDGSDSWSRPSSPYASDSNECTDRKHNINDVNTSGGTVDGENRRQGGRGCSGYEHGHHYHQQESSEASAPGRCKMGMASEDTGQDDERDGDVGVHLISKASGSGTLSCSVTSLRSKTLNSKKKKKKKSKAKSRSKSKKVESSTNATPTSTNANLDDHDSAKDSSGKHGRRALHVTFGHVRMLEFTRDVGGCGVPSEGTWGLALGLPFRDTMVEVDGYEESKAKILEAREKELSKKQRVLSTGETRQFDYRPIGVVNPLFSRLGEKDRSKRLLEYACFHKDDLQQAGANITGVHEQNIRCTDELRHSKNSAPCSDLSKHPFKISHAEFVDKSHAAIAELEAVRESRRKSQGCSCACVRADKLNLIRLREELNKRGLKIPGSKKDLARALQETMRAEEERDGGRSHRVCSSEDCQCVRDRVECHADICNCCKGPHMGKKDGHHGGVCGNPEGVYSYSSSSVRSYRAPFVTVKPSSIREGQSSRSDSIFWG